MDFEMARALFLLKTFLAVALLCSPGFAKPVLVILGDSISEGYGVAKEDSYPELLAKKLEHQLDIRNASISGSTSASAESRVKWQLQQKPDYLLIALGANDGLRGLPAKDLEDNLTKATQTAQSKGVKVFIAAMKLPMNYGKIYRSQFERSFEASTKKTGATLIPFLLEGVGGRKNLNQADGIHPNAKGHKIIAESLAHLFKEIPTHP